MRKRAKTALAFLLALSCICSTAVSAEGLKRDIVQPETVKAESVEAESGDTSKDARVGKSLSEDAETVEESQEAVEDAEEAFQQEKEISGVLVSVKADPGVFPTGAKLQVKKVGKAAERKVDSALKEKLLENR